MQLVAKTALITGAGGGISKAMAHAFAEDGANLALVDLNVTSLDAIKKEVEATGGKAIALPIDLTYPGALDSMVEETVRQLGSIDVLINNAGITWHKDFFDITEDDWAASTA